MKETFINDACSPMSFLCHSVLDTVSSETYFNAYSVQTLHIYKT